MSQMQNNEQEMLKRQIYKVKRETNKTMQQETLVPEEGSKGNRSFVDILQWKKTRSSNKSMDLSHYAQSQIFPQPQQNDMVQGHQPQVNEKINLLKKRKLVKPLVSYYNLEFTNLSLSTKQIFKARLKQSKVNGNEQAKSLKRQQKSQILPQIKVQESPNRKKKQLDKSPLRKAPNQQISSEDNFSIFQRKLQNKQLQIIDQNTKVIKKGKNKRFFIQNEVERQQQDLTQDESLLTVQQFKEAQNSHSSMEVEDFSSPEEQNSRVYTKSNKDANQTILKLIQTGIGDGSQSLPQGCAINKNLQEHKQKRFLTRDQMGIIKQKYNIRRENFSLCQKSASKDEKALQRYLNPLNQKINQQQLKRKEIENKSNLENQDSTLDTFYRINIQEENEDYILNVSTGLSAADKSASSRKENNLPGEASLLNKLQSEVKRKSSNVQLENTNQIVETEFSEMKALKSYSCILEKKQFKKRKETQVRKD